MPLNMSREEREDFLAGVHVAVPANPTGTQIVFRMMPEHWLTVDYGTVFG